MKLYSILTLMILSCIIFISCTQRNPIYTKPAKNNGDYEVNYLFTHDGCAVYRFHDVGNWVYFTNCDGKSYIQTDSTSISQNLINVKDTTEKRY